MAEGGVKQSPVKLKPVPPPKPIGATLTSPKNVIVKRPSETPAKVSLGDQSVLSPEVDAYKSNNASNDHGSAVPCVSPPQKFPSKPPLLPKPPFANLSCKRLDRVSKCDPEPQNTTNTINNASGVTRKIPFRIFIPESKTGEINIFNSGIVKAPVAKLDEFDHGDRVSPVRPPRSPKHKSLVGGPFSPDVLLKQKLLSASPKIGVHIKSFSLGRNVSPSELKIKTASLDRNEVQDIAQVLERSGSCLKSEERSPVRPPRRRNKSFNQSPEALSPSNEDGFSFDTAKQSIPVYAQVNYNFKKNRRSKDIPSSVTEILQNEEIRVVPCNVEMETVETVSCEMSCVSECDETKENAQTVCNINFEESEDCVSEEKEGVVDSDYTYFSFTSNVITSVKFSDANEQNKLNKSEPCNVNSHECGLALNSKECESHLPKCVKNEMCRELCPDCLPVKILEESLDDSVSSSKLEWQSVRSSFNSSGSESNFAISGGITDVIINSNCLEEQVLKSDASNGSMEKSFTKLCINNETLGKSDTDSSIISGFSNISNILIESSPPSERRIYKRLTNSLPTRKSYRKAQRRQSWTGYKDCTLYGEWKQTTWVDEGDSSSGNMGDLDSSDNNVGKQSSVEEVDSKVKPDQSVSKRFNLWLSSFGKTGKKRSNKRLSQFYFEKQESSKGGPTLKEKIDDNLKHLPFTTKPLASCNDLSKPHPSDNYNMNNKVASEGSIASDMQSDSDGECADDSYQEKANSVPKKLDDGKKAFYIANELMTSERVFIDALKLLNIEFKNAVMRGTSSGHPVIPQGEFDKILNSLPQLQELNENLLADLEQRIQNWSYLKKIADVIVKKGPFLKLYATYIQNYEAQCNYFDECMQKYPKFAKVVKEFEASPICQKLTVKHYMLKPVQRIPQYRLLLDDYFRHLDISSPDYEDTKEALKIVCQVADHANQSIKLGDHLSVLLQLQSQLGNYIIIKPGRVLLKDGELHKLSRKEHQPRYFILLNDCLLYTSYYGSGPSSGLKVNSEISLGGMKVTIPQAEDYHNEFSIISSTRSFTLSARSAQERREWVEAFQKAIEEYTSRQLSFQKQKLCVSRPDASHESFKLGKEAPIWIQDGRVTKCQLCVAEFTVTFRRHHCRACGKVVCGMCSAFRAPLQYMKFQPDRVCEDCYNTLFQEFVSSSTDIHEVIKQELGLKKCDKATIGNIRSQFKKLGPSSGKKTKKNIPQRLLEVTANDTGSQMCGWLQRRGKRSWKRLWFVLKEQVLYVYKASEDVVALETIPVLGYQVVPLKQPFEGIDAKLVFQLTHPNQQPLIFSAESENLVNRWITELQEATILK